MQSVTSLILKNLGYKFHQILPVFFFIFAILLQYFCRLSILKTHLELIEVKNDYVDIQGCLS